MIKDQIYSACEDIFGKDFYGFNKEDLDIGILNGYIKNLKMNVKKQK